MSQENQVPLKEELIAAILSSVANAGITAQKPKSKKPSTQTPLAGSAVTSSHVSAQNPVTGTAATSSRGELLSAPAPLEDEWTTVTHKKKNHKKKSKSSPSPATTAQKQAHAADHSEKDHLASNTFFVPKELQNKLQAVGTTKMPSKKKAPPQTKPSKISFVSIMRNHDEPKCKSGKQNKPKKQGKAQKKQNQFVAPLPSKIVEVPVAWETHSQPAEAVAEASAAATCSSSARGVKSALFSLPYHLLTDKIMSFLKPEDIASFVQCSTESKRIGEEGYLWQSMFRQRFPSSKLSPQAMTEWKLAYQLTLSKIVDHLRCFHTKKTFFDDVLGVGVDYTVNPKTKAVDYIAVTQDLLSETAFRHNKIRADAFGNKFKLFLPLYFSEGHFQRALPQIQRTLLRLACPHDYSASFQPSMILDVFPKIMTTFVVLLSDEGVSASRKSFNGLCRIHRLFMALAHQFPSIKREATTRLKRFAADEKFRVKSVCPSLGNVLPLFMIVDQKDFAWRNIMQGYVGETFDRSVLWACRKHPWLENTQGPKGAPESEADANRRVEATREAMTVTLRLLMFQVYFIHAFCRGSTAHRACQYDQFFGQLDAELDVAEKPGVAEDTRPTKTVSFESFRTRINSILNVTTWQQVFSIIGARCPATKAEMAQLLRKAVDNSRRKKYHTKGMDFSRVQASGTSRILTKGQEYSASSDLKRVTFRDIWGFKGDTKYLDATCLLYNESKSRVSTIDFTNTRFEDGAVAHSGDVMRADGGTHTIEIDLQGLPMSITTCVFVISAWADAKLSDILSPSVSFSDADTGANLCKYDLDAHDKVPHLTSVIMCKLYRTRKGQWHVQAIGDAHRGAASNYEPIYKAVNQLL